MVNPKWTVSIFFQNSDPKDIDFFNSLKEDIELQEKGELRTIKYFILRHDESQNEAILFTNNDQGIVEEVLPHIPTKGFYHDWKVPQKIWFEFFQRAAAFPSAEHFIMTHGHGAGLGFSTSRQIDKNFLDGSDMENAFNSLRILLSHSTIEESSSGRINDELMEEFVKEFNINPRFFGDEEEPSLGIIPIGLFKSAIEQAFINQKIIFLFFGNCFMQTIENGYLFKDLAKYMAATEGFYWPTGTDFKTVFQIMTNEKCETATYERIAHSICDRIPEKTNEPRMKDIFKTDISKLEAIKDEFSFSVNRLDRYEALKEAISELGEYLSEKRRLINDVLTKTREDMRICRDVFETQLLGITDLLRFCKSLEITDEFAKLRVKPVQTAINKIKNLFVDKLQPVVVAKYLPYKAFELTRQGGVSVYPEGLSVFFPRKKPSSGEQDQVLKYYINKYYKTNAFKHPFLEENKWQTFVTDYYEPVQPLPLDRLSGFINRLFR